MKYLKILNLFAGLGGNRKYWDEVARKKGINIEVKTTKILILYGRLRLAKPIVG